MSSDLYFLHGKNLKDSNESVVAGRMYLDTATNELWYDDPSGANTNDHIRLFNNATKTTDGLMSAVDKCKVTYSNVSYGTCTTAANVVNKVVTISTSDNTGWSLAVGAMITVLFSYTNTANNPTLNVNGTGAKSIYYNTSKITTENLNCAGYKDKLITYIYDGTYYRFMSWGTIPSIATADGITGGTITSSGTLKANLVSYTKNDAAATSSSSDKLYAVQLDKNGKLAIAMEAADKADMATYTKYIRITSTNPSTATTYNIPFVAGSTANANYEPRGNNGLKYKTVEGTTSAEGYSRLYLGNSTATGTAGNKSGGILIYSSGASYQLLLAHPSAANGSTAASSRTTYLRDYGATGYLIATTTRNAVGSTTKPVYISTSGVATAGSTYAGGTKVTLNATDKGATTASFYAPTSAGTASQILVSTGGAPQWNTIIPNAALPLRLRSAQSSGLDDANAATETGFYYMTTKATNRPDFSQSSNKDYRILTTAYSDSWLQQIATDFRCNDIFYRRRENGTWKNWIQLLTSEGGTLNGLLKAHGGIALDSSTAQSTGLTYILGIKAFAEGGNIVWSSATDVSVKYATSAGSAVKATQDSNGNTIVSTYLPLAGGTMNDEKAISFIINRKKASGGGWAYDPLCIMGKDKKVFARIGVYGQGDALNWMYIGSHGYDSTLNLRIAPDGNVYATKFVGPLEGNASSATNATNALKDSDGKQINTTYAKLASMNNMVHSTNEWTVVPSEYSGTLWLNYRTCGGTNGNITHYNFGNGKGGTAGVTLVADAFSGKAATAGTADNATYATSAGKISNITESDKASSSATKRRVWFSYSDNTTGRPAYDDRFTIQTSTGTLFAPIFSGNLSGNATTATTAAYANKININGISNDTKYGTYGGIIQDSSTGPNSGAWHNTIKILHNNSAGYYTSIATQFTGEDGLWFRSYRNGADQGWKRVAVQNMDNTFSGTNNFTTTKTEQSYGHHTAATYTTTASNSGYYKIKINSANNWMTAFTIRVYQSYKWSDIVISGYNYDNSYWYSPAATMLGSSDANAITVYFGYDSVYNLWVGIPASSYTGIDIIDVTNGYQPFDSYKDLFTISNVSSLGGTTQVTQTVYRPWYRNETVTNATYATTAGSVAWGNVSGKPSSFTPSSHNHDFITYKDTRSLNESPDDMQAGLTVHLKTTGKDGLSDGGSYHALLSVKDWHDYSGGPYWQSTVTANNNMHFRRSTTGTTWGAWQKVLSDNNYTDYTVTKTGSGAKGTWGISITGNANYATSAGSAGSATTADQLAQNTRMDYGWNGLNYFNISGTAGNAAKKNDTPTSAWWHILRFNHANSSGYYTDLAVPFNANSLYYKRIASGTVQNSGWVKVLDALNYNSYAPKLDGTGAKGTWGINITGNAATASSVAWGNVSGKPSSFTPSAHSHSYIDAKGAYTFNSSTLPNSFDLGVSAGFVNSDSGYGSYGSVLTVRTYGGGGGTLQLYAPYSPTYGGTRLKARFGNYDSNSGNSWTTLKELAWVEDLTWRNISGKPNYAGSSSAGGPANSANLLNLNHGSKSSTASTAMSSWNGGVSGMKYVWGQSFFDSSIGSDSGDLVFGLRAGQYASGGTELCLMLDGDYYSMGNKVLHAGNYGDYASAKNHNHNSTYVKKAGDTMTGSLTISHATSATMDSTTTNPRIVFAESGSQPVGLVYTDYDSYRSPAGLKVLSMQADNTPAWFEVEGAAYVGAGLTLNSSTEANNKITTPSGKEIYYSSGSTTWIESSSGASLIFCPQKTEKARFDIRGRFLMKTHLYMTGSNASSSTSNTSQIIFGTSSDHHIAISSNDKALVLNPSSSDTTNQIVLYLDQASVFPSGVTTSKFVATNYGSDAPTSSTTGAYAAGTLYFQTV